MLRRALPFALSLALIALVGGCTDDGAADNTTGTTTPSKPDYPDSAPPKVGVEDGTPGAGSYPDPQPKSDAQTETPGVETPTIGPAEPKGEMDDPAAPDIPAPAEPTPGEEPKGDAPAVAGVSLSEEEIAEIKALPAEEAAVALDQKVCPVSGEHLGSMGAPIKVEAEGKTAYLCCGGCKKEFEKDPAAQLKKLGLK